MLDTLQSNNNLYEIPQLELNGLTACDLFCGAGIGAYGFKHAGYNILFGIDNDPDAVKTYNLNIGEHAICEDIRKIKGENIPKHDLMIATPVCKPFTIASKNRQLTDDKRYGDLLAETIRLFSECQPKALFFENVEGIVLGDSLPIFLDFVHRIESFGYHTYWKVVNAYDLGVPQVRRRMFLTAIQDNILNEFIPPKELLFGKKSQRDAFWDLQDKTIENIKNHDVNNVPKSTKFRVGTRQSSWDEPGFTVMSHAGDSLLYPEPVIPFSDNDYTRRYDFICEHNIRKLTVRELLRLQTVGDDFYFPDSVSLIEQYNRCSGVPSLVAYKYGIAISDCLLGKTPLRKNTIHKRKSLF